MKRFLLALVAALGLTACVSGTTLTGVVRDAMGNPMLVDGTIWFEISQNANVLAGPCGGPYSIAPGVPVVYTLTDGEIEVGATIAGNDCISPANTYYKESVISSDGALVLRRSVSITGDTVDIGNLPEPPLPNETGIPGPQGPPGPAGPSFLVKNKGSVLPVQPAGDARNCLTATNDVPNSDVNLNVDCTANTTGSPALVADSIDFGTRSMSSTPSGAQNLNRRAFTLYGTGQLGYANNAGRLIDLSLTGDTGFSHLIHINHTNTGGTGDSSAIRVDTDAETTDTAAGVAILNKGKADGLYIGAMGRSTGVTGALGIGIDVNRLDGGSGEQNGSAASTGILCMNWTSSANLGTCFQATNVSATNLSPLITTTSNGYSLQAAATSGAGDANPAISLIDSTPAEKFSVTYGGTLIGVDGTFTSRIRTNGLLSLERHIITLSNGDNNSVARGGHSYLRVQGPSAAFAITGFEVGNDGDVIELFNALPQTMTIKNENAGSAIDERILTLHGADLTLRANAVSFARFIYSGDSSRWILQSYNDTSTGTAYSVTKDEGSTVASSDTIFNFVGSGVTATSGSGTTTVTIPGSTPVDVQTFTADGTWTKPSGVKVVAVVVVGGGGSGGGGSATRDAISTAGGGTGGGGGARVERTFEADTLPSTVSVTVAAAQTGGAGGAAQSSGSANGTNGTAGGTSSFGSYVTAFGGGAGGGGTSGTGNVRGAGGGGAFSAGDTGGSGGIAAGGLPNLNPATNADTFGSGGANSVPSGSDCFPKAAEWGGGAGGGGPKSGGGTTVYKGGRSFYGAGGGGMGGSHSTSNFGPGEGGGTGAYSGVGGGGGAAGTNASPPTAGTAGAAGTSGVSSGNGGGGGGSAVPGTANDGANGGNGGIPGGGGGGGGAAEVPTTANIKTGGTGGQGARGEVVVVSW